MPQPGAQPDPPLQATIAGFPVPAPAAEIGKKPALLAIARRRQETLAGLLARAQGAAGTATEPDIELVHDLRVASRRLSEVARLLAVLMDKPVAKAVKAELRELRRSAGDLRDLDVLQEHLEKWRFPARLRALRQEILAQMPPQRAALTAGVREQIASASFTASLMLLNRVLDEEVPRNAAEARLESELAALIRQRRKGVARAFGKAARKQTPTALHAARIAVKKLRYGLELQEEAERANVRKELKFLKKIQQHLGDMHDTDVVLATLQQHLEQKHPAPPGLHPAWKQWRRTMENLQARRAAEFFAASYLWMNDKL